MAEPDAHADDIAPAVPHQPDGFPLIAESIYPPNGGELYFGFVSPLGTDVQPVRDALDTSLKARMYAIEPVKLSALIEEVDRTGRIRKAPEFDRIHTLQEAGNRLRETYGHDIIAKLACARVKVHRAAGQPEENVEPGRTAYIFETLKHPEEAALFRTIYGHGFFLIAIHSAYDSRVQRLGRKMKPKEVKVVIEADEKESEDHGQNTRETFELADFYVRDDGNVQEQIDRFIRLIFRALYVTPTQDEFGMHMAATAALRSSDLSRQVGASILDELGDVQAVGCNEVPKADGGSYWPGEEPDARDFALGEDPNEREKQRRFDLLLSALNADGDRVTIEELQEALSKSELNDITEFGRTVHGEMDAVLSCARRGVSVRRSTLYCTTFPCHNCARHIIAAGIRRVAYIEPYAKSEAYNLHGDSLECPAIPAPVEKKPKHSVQVKFEPFEGVAPRRFADFFGMRNVTGQRIERKQKDGTIFPQRLVDLQTPRLQLSIFSYIQREEFATKFVEKYVYVNAEGEEAENGEDDKEHGTVGNGEEHRQEGGPVAETAKGSVPAGNGELGKGTS